VVLYGDQSCREVDHGAAMSENANTAYRAIWNPVAIPTMPMLAALREAVLIRSTKRMPKWKFRVVSDIVMQIQPRPATTTKANRGGLPWFDCIAVVCDGVDETMLKDPPRDSWKLEFRLTIGNDAVSGCAATWSFDVRRVGFHTGRQIEDCLTVRERLIDIMPVAFVKLRPAMMLKPACLACGKTLIDPVSMARWVGPDCAGTSSAIVPYTVILSEAE
jgi:hypothetical protein